jgi:hypothetical protein
MTIAVRVLLTSRFAGRLIAEAGSPQMFPPPLKLRRTRRRLGESGRDLTVA